MVLNLPFLPPPENKDLQGHQDEKVSSRILNLKQWPSSKFSLSKFKNGKHKELLRSDQKVEK